MYQTLQFFIHPDTQTKDPACPGPSLSDVTSTHKREETGHDPNNNM